MRNIYWITRLDDLETIFGLGVAFGLIALCIFIILRLILNDPEHDTDFDNQYKAGQKVCRWFIVALFLCLPGCVFVPNTKEMLIIYGVGGTIDYVTENPTARNLPDKAIKALDKFADDYIYKKDKKDDD